MSLLSACRDLLKKYQPYLIAIAYFALVMWAQSPAHPGEPEQEHWFGRLFNDDYDWTAIAIRAVNAQQGRTPGRSVDPCLQPHKPGSLARDAGAAESDKSTYFAEYPNVVIQFFRIPLAFAHIFRGVPITSDVLGSCQADIVSLSHLPASTDEGRIWAAFRKSIRFYEAEMLLFLLLLIAFLRRGYDRELRSGSDVLFALPAFLYFSINRFDIVPALLMSVSLLSLAQRRIAASATSLALGAMVKVYPVLLAPIFLRYLFNKPREALQWACIFCLSVLVILELSVSLVGLSGTLLPFRYQLSRSLEPLTIYGAIVPAFLGTNAWGPSRLAILVAVGLALVWKPIDTMPLLLSRGAALLIIFIALQVFFSPQWVIWLAPLLIPLSGANRGLIPWLIAIDLVTFLSFPLVFDHPHFLGVGHALSKFMIYARFALEAGLVYLLLRPAPLNRQAMERHSSRPRAV